MPLFTGQALGGSWRKWILSAIKDAFNRSNTTTGLGNTDTGNVWNALRGNWFINNNMAASTDTPTNYPIATVQAGSANKTISLDVDTNGGVGAAFWVTDTANWWGMFPYTATNTAYGQACATYAISAGTYYCTSYGTSAGRYYCTGFSQTVNFTCTSWTGFYDPLRGYYNTFCTGGNTSYGSTCSSSGYTPGGTVCTGSGYSDGSQYCATYSQTTTNSAGATTLRLVRSVANTVTTVIDQAISALPASIQTVLSGSSINATAYAGTGQSGTVVGTISTTQTAGGTQHGLILAPGGYTQGEYADNLTIQ